MKTSIFDLFKTGIGPSSSHTVGPMRAARQFVETLAQMGDLAKTSRLVVDLYGSLALTGIGHGTDRAVLLGLAGEKPQEVDPNQIGSIIGTIRSTKELKLLGSQHIEFDESKDLVFHRDTVLPEHPNGMRFSALHANGKSLNQQIYFSVGGGFVLRKEELHTPTQVDLPVPHGFSNAAELLAQAESKRMPIWKLMLENESALRSEGVVRERIAKIWSVMQSCIERGLATEGILPGGLNVGSARPSCMPEFGSSLWAR